MSIGLIRRSGDEGREVFALLPQSPEANTLLEDMQQPRCLPRNVGELRFDHTIIRGAMAERIYDLVKARDEQIAIYDGNANIALGSYELRYDFIFIRACECMIKDDPALADSVLDTEVGSDEEAASMGQLGARLGRCLDAGVKVDLTKAMLRSYIAEAALRGAVTSAASQAQDPAA